MRSSAPWVSEPPGVFGGHIEIAVRPLLTLDKKIVECETARSRRSVGTDAEALERAQLLSAYATK